MHDVATTTCVSHEYNAALGQYSHATTTCTYQYKNATSTPSLIVHSDMFALFSAIVVVYIAFKMVLKIYKIGNYND